MACIVYIKAIFTIYCWIYSELAMAKLSCLNCLSFAELTPVIFHCVNFNFGLMLSVYMTPVNLLFSLHCVNCSFVLLTLW